MKNLNVIFKKKSDLFSHWNYVFICVTSGVGRRGLSGWFDQRLRMFKMPFSAHSVHAAWKVTGVPLLSQPSSTSSCVILLVWFACYLRLSICHSAGVCACASEWAWHQVTRWRRMESGAISERSAHHGHPRQTARLTAHSFSRLTKLGRTFTTRCDSSTRTENSVTSR